MRDERSFAYRFTPTCVGKTPPALGSCPATPVHPHMRGEDYDRSAYSSSFSGSPPHAWGRLLGPKQNRLSCRFTPTCVGKTASRASASLRLPVHPHMRGEDQWPVVALIPLLGSPPHAWGRRCQSPLIRQRTRFTPTCVGKTTCCVVSEPVKTVHPHMRGED